MGEDATTVTLPGRFRMGIGEGKPCEICGKPIRRRKGGAGRFCCLDCRNMAMRLHHGCPPLRGSTPNFEIVPDTRRVLPGTLYCETCKRDMSDLPLRKGRRFCSKECRDNLPAAQARKIIDPTMARRDGWELAYGRRELMQRVIIRYPEMAGWIDLRRALEIYNGIVGKRRSLYPKQMVDLLDLAYTEGYLRSTCTLSRRTLALLESEVVTFAEHMKTREFRNRHLVVPDYMEHVPPPGDILHKMVTLFDESLQRAAADKEK